MKRIGVALMIVAVLALADPVLACPVCFGAADSPQTRAMQAGILALLGVTVAILGGFAAFFFIYLRRRMRMFEESSGVVEQGAHGGSY
jgi:predicted transporter